MEKLINRDTGREPTAEEMQRIRERAMQIYRNPYASPEQLEWAMTAHPEGLADAFLLEPTIYRKHRG